MALMLCIIEIEKEAEPFLVVCPTTVLSHWQQKIEMYAPGLKPVVYHGAGRDFERARKESRVILTSYGLLRRDIAHFGAVSYPLIIFDEIQHIKNAGTQAYGAAEALKANVKLGLTGTPIENSSVISRR
jgi:SNF2 family DNA or RNA helicase